MSGKSIIVYFSRKGENYVNGNIVNLTVGNTEIAATMLQKITGSDMFHIETVKTYPKDYRECTEEAKKELRENARPELTKVLQLEEAV